MTYIHRSEPVIMRRDPIDSDSTDWFYWTLGGVTDDEGNVVYQPWLRPGEAVTSVDALIVNGTVREGPTPYANREEHETGYTHTAVYGVKAQPSIGANEGRMNVTLRITTSEERENIDKTISVPVVER